MLGYKGKQVRDNIHSFDLVEAFVEFIRAPSSEEVKTSVEAWRSNCSILEAIALSEEISGRKLTGQLRPEKPCRRSHLVDQRR